jgi:hydrogenase nickel incorporation protein HypA/HybF
MMHEYSIVAALIDRVEREAEARGAEVRRLHVAIGELSGVEVDLLRTAYLTFSERTCCDGAELEIHPVAAEWRCPRCDVALDKGALLRCRGCGRPARLVHGDEIVLERIEMEVPDV